MGFGYRFPNRFKIEWLTLTRDAVREQIEQGEHMSELELRKHWRRNQLEEGIPAIEPGAPVPDAVRESLLENLTDEEMRQIEKDCTDELRMRRRGLESDQGYITLPEDWPDQRLSLEALAQTIQQAHGVTLPTYQAIGDRWLSLDDLADVPELAGVTTTRFGPTPVALSTVIQALREFEGSTSILVQEGVAFPPFQDPDGSLLIIRVTATDAARPPASLDEVRDRVARDLRRRAHYEALVASIDQIEADARSEGLLAMAMRYDTPVARSNVELYNRQFLDFYLNQQRTPQMFPSSLPVVGPDEDTIRTILDRCLDLPQDQPVTDLPVEQRIFAVPVERSLTVLLVKIRETRPLTTDLYQRLVEANAIHAIVLSEELDATEQAFDAFRYEALAARHHFALSTRQPDEDATASAPEEAPEPGGS